MGRRGLPPAVAIVAALVVPVAVSACASPAATEASAAAPVSAAERIADAPPATLASLCREHFADVPPAEGQLVGLMTDSGRINDGTFNQYAYEGMQAAARCFGYATTYVATGTSSDFQAHIDSLVDQGADAVITVGFPLTDVTTAAARDHRHVQFVGVDQFAPPDLENYGGITFDDRQVGFLAGAAAALVTDTGTIAVVAGPDDVTPVVDMVAGFTAGAAAVDGDVTVLSAHLPTFADPQAGAAQAQAFLDQGADVIHGAGGLTGSGAVRHAAAQGAWAIGVDQDEYFTSFEGGRVAGADRLVTSSVKRVDLGVFLQLADIAIGTFDGTTLTLDAHNGGVGLAPTHDAAVPTDFLSDVTEIQRRLADRRPPAGDAP